MLKKISRLKKRNKRLRRVILSEWQQIDSNNYIEELTDAMTYNYPVQINYEGSGWRTISPYGWNTSEQNEKGTGGNILLMCYKDTGEVRSYRVDKIQDLYIDKDSAVSINNNEQMNSDNDLNTLLNMQQNPDVDININDDYPDDMPAIPQTEDNYAPGVYDEELNLLLDNDQMVIEEPIAEETNVQEQNNEQINEDNVNTNEFDNMNDMEEENVENNL